jgi:ZIP family zinc transporter
MSSSNPEDNVAMGFALVTAAGLSTAVGAGLVFWKNIVALANYKFLAASLGVSAGVMAYVSFVEIFQKGVGSFEEVGFESGLAYALSTLCFFAGILITHLLHLVVHYIEEQHGVDLEVTPPAKAEDKLHKLKSEEKGNGELKSTSVSSSSDEEEVSEADIMIESPLAKKRKEHGKKRFSANAFDIETGSGASALTSNGKKLKKMGLMTALAIGLHNFPEGLATFVATLDDPAVGAALAVAIAIHNIPEGMCVAIPIYYSTGSRFKAFLWALFSGISEPIGALLGYLVLQSTMGPSTYGILFASISGMMTYIVFKELLPTAHRYDPEDKVVSASVFAGMLLMALSLVLFVI